MARFAGSTLASPLPRMGYNYPSQAIDPCPNSANAPLTKEIPKKRRTGSITPEIKLFAKRIESDREWIKLNLSPFSPVCATFLLHTPQTQIQILSTTKKIPEQRRAGSDMSKTSFLQKESSEREREREREREIERDLETETEKETNRETRNTKNERKRILVTYICQENQGRDSPRSH